MFDEQDAVEINLHLTLKQFINKFESVGYSNVSDTLPYGKRKE